MSLFSRLFFLAVLLVPVPVRAQSPASLPPIRAVGPVLKMSAAGLIGSAANARQYTDGRVMLVDLARRRTVLLNASLTTARPVGLEDSTSTAPPPFLAGNIPYLGDSTLLVQPDAKALLVVTRDGVIGRTMALPRPRDVGQLFGGPYGTPGIDRRGRLIYRADAFLPETGSTDGLPPAPQEADSAVLVRVDLRTRVVDTLAHYKIVPARLRTVRTPAGRLSLEMLMDPAPTSDEWAVLSDGTVAIVRGRDYHVDWVSPAGTVHATPRIPYAWVHLSLPEKVVYRDSVMAAFERGRLEAAQRMGRPAPTPGRGPRATFTAADLMPDYVPPFGNGQIRGSIVRADREDNLWIRTNTFVDGRPVYDVVNRQGKLVDRVSLPFGRVIVGFGPQTVLMAVVDGTTALLEVAARR